MERQRWNEEFKYGTIGGYSREADRWVGFPPALGGGIRVLDRADDNVEEYIELAAIALAEMSQITKDLPIIGLFEPINDFDRAHWPLCAQAYLFQECVPNGRQHPLYLAVTKRTWNEFKEAIEAFFAQ